MRLIQPFRPFSAANYTKPKALYFQGDLKDELDQKDRETMSKIDTIACSKPMSTNLRGHYEQYLQQYEDLNADFEFGVKKEGLIGQMKRAITQMWDKFPEEFRIPAKEHSTENKQQPIKPKPPLGSRGRSKLSQIVESADPDQA